jgi:hypothetical protein
VWKPEGTRPLGIARRRYEGNIKMDLQELGWNESTDAMFSNSAKHNL